VRFRGSRVGTGLFGFAAGAAAASTSAIAEFVLRFALL